jgi:glyoxylase-like metal-dependent hydrolase (beta-lactamase superfamily II)
VIFHADYFAAWLPENQSPELWPGELVGGEWVTPEEALHRHHHGTLFISYPVLETLRALARHPGDVAAAGKELAARGERPHGGGELIVGLHVIPLASFTLPPATTTNTYILGRDSLVVVDPGSPQPAEQDRLIAYLDRLDGEVREIWLTHHHPDHVAGVEALRHTLGVPVAAHPQTAAALEFPVDRTIEDGEITVLDLGDGVRAEWQAVHTPGHAPGHLCFFETHRGLLLSGDNVVTLSTVVIAPPDGDMGAYMASLERMRDLPARFLFPAHGPPSSRPRDTIDEYIDHRTMREEAILSALGEPLAAADLVPRVYADVDPALYPLAEINVRAHLDKLLRENRIVSEGAAFRRTD